MRYKILLLPLIALIFTACEYNEKHFPGFEEGGIPKDIKNTEYTLTALDYKTISESSVNIAIVEGISDEQLKAKTKAALAALSSTQAFSDILPASQFAPAFFAGRWIGADDGSAVKLTYNYADDLPDYLNDIANASLYTVSLADYANIWGEGGANFFTPSVPASSKLPEILTAQYPDASEDDMVHVNYNQSNEEPSGTVVAVNEDFNQFTTTVYVAEIEGWYNIITKGTYAWTGRTYSNNGFLHASAYGHKAGVSQAYMITPRFLVAPDMEMTFDVEIRNWREAGGKLRVLITESLSGDVDINAVENANWIDITPKFNIVYPTEHDTHTDMANAGTYNLADDYQGKRINIAFCYDGDGSDEVGATTTTRIDNVIIKSEGSGSEELPSYENKADLYAFNGSSWSAYTDNNAYVLQKADFTEMGSNYDNFSSSAADHYLPTFLKAKYPYAYEDDSRVVVYKKYDNQITTVKADEYIYTNGEWIKNEAREIRTDQFVKTNGKWTYNPSMVIYLHPQRNNADISKYYQTMTDWVWENIDQKVLNITEKGGGYVTKYGNNDYYTGGSAYYNNVDWRIASVKAQYADPAYDGLSDEEMKELLKERFIYVLGKALSIIHPDAKTIEGIDITFTIYFALYEGTNINTVNYQVIYKVAGDAEFEYVEDSFIPIN